MENIRKIEKNGETLAIVVKKDFNREGLSFLTDDKCGLQVGIHVQKAGFSAKPHVHLPFKEIKNLEVQEMFYVEKGKIKVEVYDNEDQKIEDVECGEGEIIILMGGHSITCLEDSKLIEIKQGPYRGKGEKRYL